VKDATKAEWYTLYTLHPTPYTLHPTPHTLHPTPHTLHPTPHTLHPTPHTLHPTPYTLHPTSPASLSTPLRAPHQSPALARPTLLSNPLRVQWFRGGLVFEAHRLLYVRWAHCRPHPSGHQLHFDSDDEGQVQYETRACPRKYETRACLRK